MQSINTLYERSGSTENSKMFPHKNRGSIIRKNSICLLALFVLAILAGNALAETLSLPENLSSVSDEAFMGDQSIAKIHFPEKIASIGARSFKDCTKLREVYVPETVTFIGEEAFDENVIIECELDSYAYEYAINNEYPMRLNGEFEIEDVVIDDNQSKATVTVTAERPCGLRIELLNDTQDITIKLNDYTIESAADHAAYETQLEISVSSYVLRATLLDAHGRIIGDPYVLTDHSMSRQDFLSKTKNDFDEESVLDFGSDGFAVLDDDVLKVTGAVSGDQYIIGTNAVLQEGSMLYMSNLNEFVKIGHIQGNQDGSYEITPDEDMCLMDCYQYLRYDADLSLEDNGQQLVRARNQTQLLSRGIDAQKGYQFEGEGNIGPFKWKVEADVIVHCKISLDKYTYGEDYLECEVYAEIEGEKSFIFAATSPSDEEENEIPLFTRSITTPVPGLLVDFDVSLFEETKVEAEVEQAVPFTARVGFSYNSSTGMTAVKEYNPKQKQVKVNGRFLGTLGIKAEVGVSAIRVLKMGFGAKLGTEITAEVSKEFESPCVSEIHACDLCLDVKVQSMLEFYANISCRISARKAIELAHVGASVPKKILFEGYLSLINDQHSLFGGKITMGSGACPNKQYRVSIEMLDSYDSKAIGNAIRVFRVDGQEKTQVRNGVSSYICFLNPGTYEAVASFEQKKSTRRFKVNDGPVDLIILEDGIPIDEETFPDYYFRKYVRKNFDYDYNGYLSDDERESVKIIQVSGKYYDSAQSRIVTDDNYARICDLAGIEYFEKIETIVCGYTGIAELDAAGFAFLKAVSCMNCASLEKVDVSGCSSLRQLDCDKSRITSLSISGCGALTDLRCSGNRISSLDASGCASLIYLSCPGNQIATINVEGCAALDEIWCSNNQITELDVSKCVSLRVLYCDENELVKINTSGCNKLETLNVRSNRLTKLDVGGKPDLKWLICDRNQISDLKVTNCASLERLDCGTEWYVGNKLTSLDLTGCANLKSLNCENNMIYSLDLTPCPELEELYCGDKYNSGYSNYLTMLDVSMCKKLKVLECACCRLTSLNISGCGLLRRLECEDNQLSVLNLNDNVSLEMLAFSDNSISNIDVSKCINLKELYCAGNSLKALDVSKCVQLLKLTCGNYWSSNQLTTLDVRNCPAIQHIGCANNRLTSLLVSGCAELESIYCINNQLTEINVKGCSKLKYDQITCDSTVSIVR